MASSWMPAQAQVSLRSSESQSAGQIKTNCKTNFWSDFGWLKAAEEDSFFPFFGTSISSRERCLNRSLPTLAPTLAAQMPFGLGPAAPALSFTLRWILFAVAERGRTFKDELSSAPQKNA
jgi:hypothetical protein